MGRLLSVPKPMTQSSMAGGVIQRAAKDAHGKGKAGGEVPDIPDAVVAEAAKWAGLQTKNATTRAGRQAVLEAILKEIAPTAPHADLIGHVGIKYTQSAGR